MKVIMKLAFRDNRLSRIGKLFAIAVISAAPIACVGAANATTMTHHNSTASAWTRREVRGLLLHNPGSKQISVDSIRAKGDVIISAIPDSASRRCPGGHLCLFWDSVWRGDQLTMGPYNGCGYYNLNNYYGSDGHSWANEASSIDNPLPRPNPPARFAHGGTYVFAVPGGHYYKNLADDYGSNGHVMNDYITNVHTC